MAARTRLRPLCSPPYLIFIFLCLEVAHTRSYQHSYANVHLGGLSGKGTRARFGDRPPYEDRAMPRLRGGAGDAAEKAVRHPFNCSVQCGIEISGDDL